MTEDAQIPSSISEYSRDVSSEKPQLQVIDIIDQIANSVEIYPYEEAEPTAGTILAQENQEEPNHLVENGACKVSVGESELQGNPEGNGEKKTDSPTQETGDWEDDESGKGLCEESQSTRTKEPQQGGQSKLEERRTWRPPDEKMTCSTDQAEEELEEAVRREPKGQTQEEAPLKDLGSAMKEESESQEGEIQNESNRDVHQKRQEATSTQPLPVSPSCSPQTEKPDEQPGILKKNDIYRHSYSRYNTISYRKIRKGNTKQRIDEFESMMHS